MNIGIERLSFYTSRYFLDLSVLAAARNIDPNKYWTGLGQEKMAVLAPNEDIVTMAASAAREALAGIDPDAIAMVLIATESGVDQSKAAGIWVHHLLGLSKHCRIIELKQACYSGCAALMLATSYIKEHPEKKVLVLAADVARYGLHTPGEPTQGCGAAAIVLSSEPKLVALEPKTGCYTSHVMDFWRPNYKDEALVDGKYSTKVYLNALSESWEHYCRQSGRSFADHAYFCYHIPFTRMAAKAHERLAKLCSAEAQESAIADSLHYSKSLGNSYTASLFIGLCSLLENSVQDLSGKRIGFFSYGSGCVAEFFSGLVVAGYKEHVKKEVHQKMLSERKGLGIEEYEAFYNFRLPEDGGIYTTPHYSTGPYFFAGIDSHQRNYMVGPAPAA